MESSEDNGLYMNCRPVQTSAVETRSLHATKPKKIALLEPGKDATLDDIYEKSKDPTCGLLCEVIC